jgi:hypothetical protein
MSHGVPFNVIRIPVKAIQVNKILKLKTSDKMAVHYKRLRKFSYVVN